MSRKNSGRTAKRNLCEAIVEPRHVGKPHMVKRYKRRPSK